MTAFKNHARGSVVKLNYYMSCIRQTGNTGRIEVIKSMVSPDYLILWT